MSNYYVRSAAAGAADGTTWADAYTTLAAAISGKTNADTIWVANDHAETQATAMTLTLPTAPGMKILCVNTNVTEPPTGLATTATVTTTSASNIDLIGFAYFYGIIFSAGSGASSASITLGASAVAAGLVFDSCKFSLAATSAGNRIHIGVTNSTGADDMLVDLINPVFLFSATGHTILLKNSIIRISGMTIDGSGSTPTTLFTNNSGAPTTVLVEASDLSGEVFTNLVSVAGLTQGDITFRNCKMPAFTSVVTGTNPGPGGTIVRMHNCDSADTNYRFAEHSYLGSVVNEQTLVRTGGASDGTTAMSFEMVSSSGTLLFHPLVSPEIVQWNDTTGSAKTVTVEILHDSATALTDAEIWIEVIYLGTSGFPQGTIISDRATDVFATPANQTSSSETWTTTGMANPNKQKLAVTFTPQEKGYFVAQVHLAKGSYTVYVDPLLTVS